MILLVQRLCESLCCLTLSATFSILFQKRLHLYYDVATEFGVVIVCEVRFILLYLYYIKCNILRDFSRLSIITAVMSCYDTVSKWQT